jgi:small multidrug resistance pump
MSYIFLTVAIISEVIATSFLKQSEGFTRLILSLIMIVGSIITFYSKSLALLTVPTGVAYGRPYVRL